MARLSVNINKVALIRNSRGGNLPDVIQFAIDCERFGAEGITVHPRPDERHIRYNDVYELKKVVTTEFNIEGNPTKRFVELVTSVRPAQVTLVPDPPEALTSNAGWDTIKNQAFLQEVNEEFHRYGIRVSIFVDPDPKMVEGAVKCQADRIELYTEKYAKFYSEDPAKAIEEYVDSARMANNCGLGINAGHDLNLKNLRYFRQNIPDLLEVSIGHALISDALYFGIENTIQFYLRELQ
ncbi:MAG: pyridoxine 5'-phosphate synthase [Sphingobacteriales bacterium]|nr:pyridoxine 5'-phosphate synthase [Sphingobacteriales bacterium]